MKGFGGGGMAQLMKQANQMQAKMKKVQDELATRQYEGTSGGGAVKVTVTGESVVTAIQIDAEVLKAGDVEMLQDMIKTSVNEAIKKAKDTSAQEMQKVTGGLNIPGMF